MTTGPSQASSLKENPLDEEGGDYIVEEVERESVEALAQPHSGDQLLESHRLSGPQNPWKHLDQKTQSLHQDMTILHLTDDPLSLTARNLVMEFLRVAEKDHVDPDLHVPPGKTSPHASDA